MRAHIQRVSKAEVRIAGSIVGAIDLGFLMLLGIAKDDGKEDQDWVVRKTIGLRVFEDPSGKMNHDVLEAGGAILLISQFTLYADIRKGRRPDFGQAATPESARPIYEATREQLRRYVRVETGVFGAQMDVSLTNCGPATFLIDSSQAPHRRR